MAIGKFWALGGVAAAALALFSRMRRQGTPEEGSVWQPESTGRAPDPIDQAIAESFPASDPPSYAGSTSTADRDGV
ncbi:MAG TPA: hypothetical protein VG872_10335 [Acidimicrobiia bacterium]|jgi:hypothetical protein|nr:hypothetical protein [Acidimicrobiia bacterium]